MLTAAGQSEPASSGGIIRNNRIWFGGGLHNFDTAREIIMENNTCTVRACVRACVPRRVHDDAQVCMIHIWSSAALRLMAPPGDPLSICFLFVPSLSWQIAIAREKHPGEQDPHIVCACVRVLLPLLYSHYCRASPWVASGAISQTITSGLAIHSISTWAGTAYSMSGAATER